LGQQFLVAVLAQLPLVQDPEVVGYVNKVGRDVVNHLQSHNFPFHFFVVNSSDLNAFAGPGGYVFMNRGLIEIMDDEGELASILSHEIAHVQSRHIAQRIARAKKLNFAAIGGLLAGIFLGGEAGAAILTGSQAGATQAMLNSSRQDEEEADRRGLRYLEATGYEGQDFVRIMRKMGQDSWKMGGHVPTYFLTHPAVPERVGYLATTVQTRPKPARVRIKDHESFLLMQAKLYGSYEIPKEAKVKFQQWLGQAETKAIGYYGMGMVLQRQRDMNEAVKSFQRAIALRPDLYPILVELGYTYFQMGKIDKAISVLESALTLAPDHPVALYGMGRCMLEQERAAEASKYLARAAQINDSLPEIHYYLGLAYGKMNQLGEAHYQFGIHYQRSGSLSNAVFHYEEALRHQLRPDQRAAIEKRLAVLKKQKRAARREQR
jgi:predicted Zn-dependent protease